MIKKLAVLSICLCLCNLFAYAGKKIPPIKKNFSFKQSAAFQEALRHAQAVKKPIPPAAPKKPQPLKAKTQPELLALLEKFVEQKGYFPRSTVPEEWELYTRLRKTISRNNLGKNPVFQRIRQLRAQTARKIQPSQFYLAELETFIAKNGYFPRSNQSAEANLYNNVNKLLVHLDPQNPVALRIQELKAATQQRSRKNPYQHLEKLENFVEKNLFFPRANTPGEQHLYVNLHNVQVELGPKHPVSQRIEELRAQNRLRMLKTPQGWLYELQDFITANNRYPMLGISAEENQFYFELDNLLKKLVPTDPVALRVNELRTEYAQPAALEPVDFTYQPQDTDLAVVQQFMAKNNNFWPEIVPMAGNVEVARHLYLTVLKDHQGLLSKADRQQLYALFAHNSVYSVSSIVGAYEKWKQAHATTPLRMPTEQDLQLDPTNPRLRAWHPQQFEDMKQYLKLPWMWNTATLIYLGQRVYVKELPLELMRVNVFR